MSVLISGQSVDEAAQTIRSKGYYQKLSLTTIKGVTSCATKKNLLNFMIMQVVSAEGIPVSESDCKCLKNEMGFEQDCE